MAPDRQCVANRAGGQCSLTLQFQPLWYLLQLVSFLVAGVCPRWHSVCGCVDVPQQCLCRNYQWTTLCLYGETQCFFFPNGTSVATSSSHSPTGKRSNAIMATGRSVVCQSTS